jgi:hypothetical protein
VQINVSVRTQIADRRYSIKEPLRCDKLAKALTVPAQALAKRPAFKHGVADMYLKAFNHLIIKKPKDPYSCLWLRSPQKRALLLKEPLRITKLAQQSTLSTASV